VFSYAGSRPNPLLYLTRKPGETIMIDEDVEITVISVSGKAVKLGFVFPPGVTVLRKEVFDRIQAENRAAAENTPDLANLALPASPKLPPRQEGEDET
jgi:carbon storage regulator